MKESGSGSRRRVPSSRALGVLLFVGLIAVYHANWTVLEEGDAVPSVNLPATILDHGRLSFSVADYPEMFKWIASPPFKPTDDFYFRRWHERFGEKSAAEWRKSGHLKFNGPRYYIVKSPKRDVYVSTFGPVPGFVLFPVMAVVHAIDPLVGEKFLLKLSLAKLQGSLLVAATAWLLYGVAVRLLTRKRAFVVALVYGLATCAWAVSSQSLWQQTVNQFFLMLGAYFFVQREGSRNAALAGLALGAATACRPTAALFLALVTGFLALSSRRRALICAACSAPPIVLIAVYNLYYFGSPVAFAQELVGHQIAFEKTGSRSLWQTPLWLGLAGLLTSPSRGLLVFSPLLGLSFWGIVRIWREAGYRDFRPLTIGALATMLLQSRWFDWWGGWTYGYRPWLDVVPFLTLFLIPITDTVLATRWRRSLFAAAFAWSVFVQGVGALSYDRSWNARQLFVVRLPNVRKPFAFASREEAVRYAEQGSGQYIGPTLCDIDNRICRYRLWSVEDSIIVYHLFNYGETRGRRLPQGWSELSIGG